MKRELTFLRYLSLVSLLLLGMVMFGCKGDNGSPGVSTGVLSGTVTNSLTGTPVAGATIAVNPNVEGTTVISTDSNGHYSVSLPLTVYSVTISAPNYTSQTFTDSILAGQVTTQNAALVPTSNAVVGVAPVTNAAPGQTVTLRAVPAIFNGVTATPTFTWTQISGPQATIINGNTATPTIVLADRKSYKWYLARAEAPRQSVDPATEVPIYEPLNRTQVVGLTNEALITGLQATFQVTMTAGSDSATTPVTVTVKPFFAPQTSLRNVPIGQPVLLQGDFYTVNVFNTASKTAAAANSVKSSWNWTMTKPAGSNAAFANATSQYPDFMPDVFGSYSVSETTTGKAFKVYAGTWMSTITGLDSFGDPTADPAARNANALSAGVLGCGCHYVASDPENGKFTRSWNRSGHAHIVSGLTQHLPGGPTTQNITDPNGHWTPQACGPCHTVGFAQYSSPIKANGFSEIYRLEGLKITKGPNAWTDTIANYPLSASFMQISCQNCHGPTVSPAHTSTLIPGTTTTAPAPTNDFFARVSFSSDVCGVCHGEPTRHGKWQQWRSSGHGDFETALFEGLTGASATSLGSIRPQCGGCHTGQGFSPFNSQLKGSATTPALASRTLNATALANSELQAVNLNTVQPQVCVTCHSPHNPGTKSGLTGSIVSLAGYDVNYGTTFVGTTPLLPAGFLAAGVGRGALCIVCHESRNGEPVAGAGNPTLHEDGDVNFDPTLPTTVLTAYSGPHDAAQGDVLMGRNAYFVQGVRSPHSLIADTCVNCHMELMPAPSDLDPARLGTNHNFAVNLDVANICANCHQFSGGQIQDAFVSQYNADLAAVARKIYFIKTGQMPTAAVVLTYTPGSTPTISVTGSTIAGANTTGNVPLATVTTGGVTTTGYLAGVTYKGTTYATGFIPVLYKANWNLMLVNNDSSEGIHNPGFENDVLQQTFIHVSTF